MSDFLTPNGGQLVNLCRVCRKVTDSGRATRSVDTRHAIKLAGIKASMLSLTDSSWCVETFQVELVPGEQVWRHK